MPKAGGSPAALTGLVSNPSNLALDASYVYWAEALGSPPPPSKVHRVSKAGGPIEDLATGVPGVGGHLAVDLDRVYLADFGAGVVRSLPVAGGAPMILADPAPIVVAIVDEADVRRRDGRAVERVARVEQGLVGPALDHQREVGDQDQLLPTSSLLFLSFMLSHSHDGKVDFYEFVSGMAIVCSGSTEEKVECMYLSSRPP